MATSFNVSAGIQAQQVFYPLSYLCSLNFWDCLSLNVELTDDTRLVGQQAQESCHCHSSGIAEVPCFLYGRQESELKSSWFAISTN